MSKPIEISEIFMSLEGEGPYTTRPTAYIRFARCQFTCCGFNNPNNNRDNKGYAPLSFDPATYKSLNEIPLIEQGCDSQYAVNPSFSHMWEKLTIDQIADRLKSIIPHGKWVHPETGLPVILSLTGGEPMLHWKRFKELLNHPFISQCKHILVETNCAVPLTWECVGDINEWLSQDPSRHWTWSNSPKLSASGEDPTKAIRPDIANAQEFVSPPQMDQYFKFVCGANKEQFNEVADTMKKYHKGGVSVKPNVYIMPEACSQEQQQRIAQAVAKMCMESGYLFCYRFQNALWGNGVGT